MNGDHKEWEDFEQEIIAMREKTKEKKKRQKQRRRETSFEAAKQSQEEAFREETRRRMASENGKQTSHSQASAASIGDADVYSIEAPVILPDLLLKKKLNERKQSAMWQFKSNEQKPKKRFLLSQFFKVQ